MELLTTWNQCRAAKAQYLNIINNLIILYILISDERIRKTGYFLSGMENMVTWYDTVSKSTGCAPYYTRSRSE